jgi:hypothetical protein
MTDWNEKNDYMSLVICGDWLDTGSMDNTNIKQNTPVHGFCAAPWREAMGPGYQAATFGRSVERRVGEGAVSPAAPTGVAAPERQSGRAWFHRVRDLVRHHPGYVNSLSQQALDGIGRIASDSRRR